MSHNSDTAAHMWMTAGRPGWLILTAVLFQGPAYSFLSLRGQIAITCRPLLGFISSISTFLRMSNI